MLHVQEQFPLARIWKRHVGLGQVGARMMRFNTPGMSDLWGILPGGIHFEVEVKTGTGRLSGPQRDWQETMRKLGAPMMVAYCTTADDVKPAATSVSSWLRDIISRRFHA